MMEKLDGNRGRRAVRDMIDDIDYVAKLSEADREWLEVFVAATAGEDKHAQTALQPAPKKLKMLTQAITRESKARRRDVMNLFNRAPFVEQADEDIDINIESLAVAKSEFFQIYRCSRCLARADVCTCPVRQRNKPYGIEDYTPFEENEDTMLSAIDTKRRIEAYDILPYGNPEGLRIGTPVQICLPRHLFKNAYGVIIEDRQDGKWLVDVQSRKGLKDRDGEVPAQITIWVEPAGLRKSKPRLVK